MELLLNRSVFYWKTLHLMPFAITSNAEKNDFKWILLHRFIHIPQIGRKYLIFKYQIFDKGLGSKYTKSSYNSVRRQATWNFLISPVVKTSGFSCRGHGFNIWWETKNHACHVVQSKIYKKKTSNPIKNGLIIWIEISPKKIYKQMINTGKDAQYRYIHH